MDAQEALKTFAKHLANPCPACKAPKGQLCSTTYTWVHSLRFSLVRPYDKDLAVLSRSKGLKP